jgi:hypothetical protein
MHGLGDSLHVFACFEGMFLMKFLFLFLELFFDHEVACGAFAIAHFTKKH